MERPPAPRTPIGLGSGIGIAIGAGFGLIFAPLLNWNIALAVGVGAAFGLIFGSAFDAGRARGPH